MNEVKKLLFIVNKYSGVGYQPQLEGKIIDACKAQDIECTIEFTKGPGHATDLATQAISQFDGTIAVGGDGTVNEVARGVVHSSLPMGILPKGSGNGLARHIGMSMNIERALHQLLQGKIIRMDSFTLNNKLSINVSGIGFDGHVANLFSTGTKRGLWGYTKLVALEYFRYKEFSAEFTLDTQHPSMHESFMMAIANSSQYGNNAWVSPHSSIADQSLQLAIVKKIPLYKGISFGYSMFTKGLTDNSRYHMISFKNASIKTQQPVAYHIDGEPCGHADLFDIRLQPQSLSMMIPADRIGKV